MRKLFYLLHFWCKYLLNKREFFNILTCQRKGSGTSVNLNNYTYAYQTNTNRLLNISNSVNSTTNSYDYDAIGNTIKDDKQGVSANTWNVYGKLATVQKTDGTSITYSYDASGNRISKTVNPSAGTAYSESYVHDAQGNILSIYRKDGSGSLAQSEINLYGSSRLGMVKNPVIQTAAQTPQYLDKLGNGYLSIFSRGKKLYELTEHRGNVMVTLSDKVNMVATPITVDPGGPGGPGGPSGDVSDVYVKNAIVVSANDYSSFGVMLSGRTYNSEAVRHGFNGLMKVPEVGSDHYTALYGEYSAETGRRWNLDPKPADGISIYSVFLNSPIWRNDILLDTPTTKQAALMANNSYAKFDPKNPEQKALKDLGWNRVEKIKTNLFGKSNQEVSLDDIGAVSGYNIALYSRTLNGKTEWVLANAGTADVVDVGSDARNLTGSSDQYAFSVRFAKSLQNGMGGQEMTYVGHSLGGGLAAANSLATGNAAITFNPAGVSLATRWANNLPSDQRNGQIQSFVVGGEAIDRSQRLVGSKANGKTTYIHPELGKIDGITALYLRFSTDVITSIQYHMMSTVIQSLDKAGIK